MTVVSPARGLQASGHSVYVMSNFCIRAAIRSLSLRLYRFVCLVAFAFVFLIVYSSPLAFSTCCTRSFVVSSHPFRNSPHLYHLKRYSAAYLDCAYSPACLPFVLFCLPLVFSVVIVETLLALHLGFAFFSFSLYLVLLFIRFLDSLCC